MKRRAGELITIALILLLAGLVWRHIRKAVDANLADTTTSIVRQDSVVETSQDSLMRTRGRSDAVRARAKAATSAYDSLRASVDTARAEQPLGMPVGSVVVSIDFVRAADSLAVVVTEMEQALVQERAAASLRIAAADSSVILLRGEVAELRIAAELSAPRVSGTLKTIGITTLAVVAGMKLFGH